MVIDRSIESENLIPFATQEGDLILKFPESFCTIIPRRSICLRTRSILLLYPPSPSSSSFPSSLSLSFPFSSRFYLFPYHGARSRIGIRAICIPMRTMFVSRLYRRTPSASSHDLVKDTSFDRYRAYARKTIVYSYTRTPAEIPAGKVSISLIRAAGWLAW